MFNTYYHIVPTYCALISANDSVTTIPTVVRWLIDNILFYIFYNIVGRKKNVGTLLCLLIFGTMLYIIVIVDRSNTQV